MRALGEGGDVVQEDAVLASISPLAVGVGVSETETTRDDEQGTREMP